MANPLIIIDVQPKFLRSEEVVNSCMRLANHFKSKGEPVFIVEYVGFDQTYERLTAPLLNYENAFFVRKDDLDGAPQIMNVINRCGIKVDHFSICGVYRNDCVLSTAIGLALALPEVPVIAFDDAMEKTPPAQMWDRLKPQVQVTKWGEGS